MSRHCGSLSLWWLPLEGAEQVMTDCGALSSDWNEVLLEKLGK